jgi:pantothenate synthetase
MRTCVERLISTQNVDASIVRVEIQFLESTLESLRINQQISNDAYLDAGAIQGGLSMLANLIEHGIENDEIQQHFREILTRGAKLEQMHPDLDAMIESCR